MLAATELRVAQARAVRQRAARYTAHYKSRAEDFRKRAARAPSSKMRTALLRLASLNEALSNAGGDSERVRDTEPDALLDELPETSSNPDGDNDLKAGAHTRAARAGAQDKRAQAFSQILSNDDQDIALQARIAISQTLYYNTLEVSQQTRGIIDRKLSTLSGEGTGWDEINSPVTMTELRDLLNSTKECLARTVRAQQRAVRYLEHERLQAEEFKREAARAASPEVRESLLRIAASYERLVRSAGGAESLPIEPPEHAPQKMGNAAVDEEEVLSRKAREDPIAQAHRHVAEARGHIARQEALVARLSGDVRHATLAAEARVILATLKQTLNLAHQHLEMELKK